MAHDATRPISTENAIVEVQPKEGGDYIRIVGASGVSETGGDAPTRETRTFAAVYTHTGNASPPSISITMNAFAPISPVARMMIRAYRNNDALNFRYTFAGRQLEPSAGAGNTAAIAATTGVVTFVPGTTASNPIGIERFQRDDAGPGATIKIGGKHYVIKTVSASAVTVVDPTNSDPTTGEWRAPSSQVAASVFSIELPSIRRPGFQCRIMNIGNIDAQVDGDVTSTIEIQPITTLPDWEIVTS